MSYFFDLEEQLSLLKRELRQQRCDFKSPHDKLHELKKRIEQLESKFSDLAERVRGLE